MTCEVNELPDYGIWVGGTMAYGTGAGDPIARNTMAADLVASGRHVFGEKEIDIIVLVVPNNRGEDFMNKISEALGGSRDTGERVI